MENMIGCREIRIASDRQNSRIPSCMCLFVCEKVGEDGGFGDCFQHPFYRILTHAPTGRPVALVEISPSAEVVLFELLELKIEVPAPKYAVSMPDHMYTDFLKVLAKQNPE
jgi:hypothetical protein